MQETTTKLTNRPAWIDLATSDAAAAREFYGKLFGWDIEVSDDPQYGGYATAKLGEKSAAGIGPKQDPNMPSAWSLYVGTDDIDGLSAKVEAAGGRVIAPAFDVGDQGKMAVYQDPSGAFFSGWQAAGMSHFVTDAAGAFGWAEVNARGVEQAIPFYVQVFGWTAKRSLLGDSPDAPPYTELQQDGESIAGAWEMSPEVPAEVPSYWQIYFNVDDVDAAYKKAIDLGATEMLAPQDFPGGRFAIVSDPQGASFGLLRTGPR